MVGWVNSFVVVVLCLYFSGQGMLAAAVLGPLPIAGYSSHLGEGRVCAEAQAVVQCMQALAAAPQAVAASGDLRMLGAGWCRAVRA